MNLEINFEGKSIPIEKVFYSKNQIKLVVDKDLNVKLYCRRDTPDGFIQSFVVNKKDWIIKHFKKFENKKNLEDVKFTDGSTFRYLGREYTLRFINRAENYIEIYQDFIVIASNQPVSRDIAHKALTGWLTHKAKETFPDIVNQYLNRLVPYNLSINTLYIRPMTSRWGTCHKVKQVVTLNSYLMQEPMPFIEYVVLHELCHLKHANHSKRFYDFVAQFMPDWQERRKMRNRNIEEE